MAMASSTTYYQRLVKVARDQAELEALERSADLRADYQERTSDDSDRGFTVMEWIRLLRLWDKGQLDSSRFSGYLDLDFSWDNQYIHFLLDQDRMEPWVERIPLRDSIGFDFHARSAQELCRFVRIYGSSWVLETQYDEDGGRPRLFRSLPLHVGHRCLNFNVGLVGPGGLVTGESAK